MLGKPVDLFPGSTFRVTYKAANGSVHGTVENWFGATVLLIPDNVQTMGFGRMVTCKTDGSFDMSGVPPGDYFAAAFAQFQRNASADAFRHCSPESLPSERAYRWRQTAVSVQLKLNPSLE